MKVYHYNNETGELIAEGFADANPLEAGSFLIPANSTETPPQVAKDGKTRHFTAGAWEYRDIPPPPPPPVVDLVAIENAKAMAKLAAIDAASIRAMREYIAAKPDATAFLKTKEQEAQAERQKIK